MQETLAAAVIMATGWSGQGNFINPMCGSGTLAIEASLIALNRPPGLLRDNFGFMHIKGFNKELWSRLRENAKSSIKKRLDFRIIASDSSAKAVEAAKKMQRQQALHTSSSFISAISEKLRFLKEEG